MSPLAPISIAIIGAGIGGITLAIGLSNYNPSLKLTIFESRLAFSEIGAGVGFGPNAIKALTLISPKLANAYNKVKTANLSPQKVHLWFDLCSGIGPRAGELIAEVASNKAFVHGGASRAQFLDGLVELIPEDVEVVFEKRVVAITRDEPDGKMAIRFDDGTEEHAHAVIGCDGIRSACRRILLGEDDKSASAVYSGKYAYRKVVPMEKAVQAVGMEVENRQIYSGYGGHLLMFPIKNGQALNLVVFKDAEGEPWTQRQWVVPSSREAILSDFKGWGEKATKILEVFLPFVPVKTLGWSSVTGHLLTNRLVACRRAREMGTVRPSASTNLRQRPVLYSR